MVIRGSIQAEGTAKAKARSVPDLCEEQDGCSTIRGEMGTVQSRSGPGGARGCCRLCYGLQLFF